MPSDSPRSRSWSLVDLGAAAAALLAIGGVIWSPRLSGAVAQATGALEPVTVMVDVRGAPAAAPLELLQQARTEGKVAIVIRNQPHGSVVVKQILPFDRIISTLTPGGKVVSAPDPNQKTFSTFDGRFVLEGQGRRTSGGVVFGNQTIKIGTPVELEGTNFRFNGTVTDLKLGAS
ncbi:DUF4330 domain-containing protein [Cyanobium sp. Cruz CV13-4-11]|jgi:hypothetical protein|uniref:DUF4330 domain-containing protein n=1 Tax=unclassified Cyanobium TaxID=2627006 RepID=UPI0020CD9906|nr:MULTISPECIES: DUF4330 domain-containing protein [unclassified Cyanobium]MCP9899031.1 DUF4330 domain-containing protein [Cyanobium sp. Cruz CV11-17]MCP9918223.1 DUF4330 domain-containing protein [Cyanobium sp. Cruz CV13-4-11]